MVRRARIRLRTGGSEFPGFSVHFWYRSANNIQHAFAMNCFANELAAAAGRGPRPGRVSAGADRGRYVNPEGVRKQIEGAAIYGNTVAQFGKITTSKGAVVQSNFHDYPITRMNNAPLDVRVHIVEDFVHLRPCGVGEPGVPPCAPALVNAIHDATGKRIRTLPIGDQLKSA